jgi:hypothetical protein
VPPLLLRMADQRLASETCCWLKLQQQQNCCDDCRHFCHLHDDVDEWPGSKCACDKTTSLSHTPTMVQITTLAVLAAVLGGAAAFAPASSFTGSRVAAGPSRKASMRMSLEDLERSILERERAAVAKVAPAKGEQRGLPAAACLLAGGTLHATNRER